MAEEKIVLSNWLTDRFEVDANARNKNVEMHFLKQTANTQNLHLVDLGSGTGGNLVYLLAKIKGDQTWHLVEQDAVLIEACKHRLSQLYTLKTSSKNEVSFNINTYTINLKWYHTDITAFLKNKASQNNFDVVTASALFDVLPKSTFQNILDFVRLKQLILFGTLNYDKTVFENTTEADEKYAQLYQQHMKLPQSYGIKMGGDCKADILSLLNKTEKQQLIIGESNWLLNQAHSVMLAQLIQFFAESIPDLLGLEDEQKNFNNWLDLKNQEINNNELSVLVEHFDFLLSC